jgi:hypothetical protein
MREGRVQSFRKQSCDGIVLRPERQEKAGQWGACLLSNFRARFSSVQRLLESKEGLHANMDLDFSCVGLPLKREVECYGSASSIGEHICDADTNLVFHVRDKLDSFDPAHRSSLTVIESMSQYAIFLIDRTLDQNMCFGRSW